MAGPAIGVKRKTGRSAFRGLAWIGGAIAWTAAIAIAAVLAVFAAATLVVISIMGFVLLALTGAGVRARRSVKATADPNLIEARNVGGHSWVAYSWDQQGR